MDAMTVVAAAMVMLQGARTAAVVMVTMVLEMRAVVEHRRTAVMVG